MLANPVLSRSSITVSACRGAGLIVSALHADAVIAAVASTQKERKPGFTLRLVVKIMPVTCLQCAAMIDHLWRDLALACGPYLPKNVPTGKTFTKC